MASVLITGCSTGIGHATAARLARSGRWTVYASARRVETLAGLEALGCRVLALDVTDEASMAAAVDAVEGGVDVLVNNAGYSLSGALETLPMEEVRRQFETNVFGLLRLTQLVLPGMRERRSGTIVNLSSMGGKLTFPGGGAYHATKYAVEAISDALRVEVAPFGVRVIVIEPGLIRTEFSATASSGVRETGPYAEFNAAVARSTRDAYHGPLGRLGGDAGTVAEAIEAALLKPKAPTRVLVTPSARLLVGLRRVLPDRAWDRAVGRSFR
ncbi:SDR family NAD(P)-dependent oxidoreductase [Solirubrobacter sp. CPCC 204708]|uniref:SDR family NAD(P)-dependent oxidoreductase n=1 Tax=Solirubrobacter deserti TaxID=2282478 RepID=A0ABT4RR30_9ACTN|nr:SDR family NAD(P)-dependent oxidoreductase [Solirubrobacter deserti]MBE2320104.1 SDR family NAD(P)-dependent oxidoreductase [Solirubrobacter deserti]MDA0140957.1 SDR family NAD(P)-dependent oxidoreductase [Solirubrobacter deserti]